MKHNINTGTSIQTKPSLEGETIETKVQRILSTKEPITDGAPIIYMERSEGIDPDSDIRTDRFDIAIDAMDVVSKSKIAKRNPLPPKEEIQGTEPPKTPAA